MTSQLNECRTVQEEGLCVASTHLQKTRQVTSSWVSRLMYGRSLEGAQGASHPATPSVLDGNIDGSPMQLGWTVSLKLGFELKRAPCS